MAKVMAILRVMPEDVETDLEELRRRVEGSLPSDVSLQRVGVEEIAFGIRALKLVVLLPEEEGGTFKVEEAVSKVPGVSQVDVELVTRV